MRVQVWRPRTRHRCDGATTGEKKKAGGKVHDHDHTMAGLL
jgi:hypothetical protein